MTDRGSIAHRRAAADTIASQMVRIDAGAITLVDEGTRRRWNVRVGAFYLGAFAVLRRHYLPFSQAGADDIDAAAGAAGAADDDDADLPIVDVSWDDAVAFCNRVSAAAGLRPCYARDAAGEVTCDWAAGGYRLPSEAEWEYACRAGSDDVRYGPLDAIAWYRDNAGRRLHEVGTRAPNAWGLYDMIGNAWEWCWDLYDPKVYGPYRVFRGGGWSDPPRGCRASCRRKSHPTFHVDDLGFRLARSAVAGQG